MKQILVIEEGIKINHLTCIKYVGIKNKARTYLWKCDCGNEKEISATRVRSNHDKSCGCLNAHNRAGIKIGDKFNKLKIIEIYHKKVSETRTSTYCKVLCDCGSIKELKLSVVAKGYYKSCNCTRIAPPELQSGEKYNNFTVISFSHSKKDKRYYNVKCNCGKETIVMGTLLKNGRRTACIKCNKLSRKPKTCMPDKLSLKRKVLSSYKNSAKHRGLEFKLTEEEFLSFIDKDCYYCGGSPNKIMKHHLDVAKRELFYNGIDRVDNSKGYTIENSVTCCYNCNRAKATLTQEEFLELVKNIYNRVIKSNEDTKPI